EPKAEARLKRADPRHIAAERSLTHFWRASRRSAHTGEKSDPGPAPILSIAQEIVTDDEAQVSETTAHFAHPIRSAKGEPERRAQANLQARHNAHSPEQRRLGVDLKSVPVISVEARASVEGSEPHASRELNADQRSFVECETARSNRRCRRAAGLRPSWVGVS